MALLLLADHANGRLGPATAKTLSAALRIGDDVHVLVAGDEAGEAAEAAAKLDGVAKVLHATGPGLAHGLAEPLADLVLSLSDGYDVFLAPATTFGKNVMPRLAALLDVMQISEVIEVVASDTFRRPIYAGNAIETVRGTDPKKVLTVRAASFPAAADGGTAPIEAIAGPAASPLSQHVEDRLSASERPELTAARVIVSGGRGLQSKEKFMELLEPIADLLGAGLGASRAAVDSGFAPNDWQVGQTGKVVAPELYVAVGISGAIQHLAGMKEAKVIVAINKDEEAPIFQVADYRLVGDLFQILPELKAALEAATAAG